MFDDLNKNRQQNPTYPPDPADPNPNTTPLGQNYNIPRMSLSAPASPIMPSSTPQPAAPTPSFTPTPNIPPKPPIRPPLTSLPITEQNILNDEEQSEMIKRDKLSKLQKIILIIIAVVVLASLIGGGIWLYLTINPFGKDATTNTNKTNATINTNSNKANKNLNANINSVNNSNSILDNRDLDGDGLKDLDELQYGTSANNPDTDGDGYTDFDEIKNGYNPLGEGKLIP